MFTKFSCRQNLVNRQYPASGFGKLVRIDRLVKEGTSAHNPAWRAVQIERSRWSNVTRHPSSSLLYLLHSEEVGRPLQRPVQLPLTSEVQHGNRIDCSLGAVFARWRRLGILSLARLARSRTRGVDEGGSTLEMCPRTFFQVP